MIYDSLLHRLRTPIETINILGCGGIKMGTMCEFWGPPGGGKSTSCYQIAGYFLDDYPQSILHILDAENSFDDIRMKYVFNVDKDDPRVIVEPAPTIEDVFEKIAARMAQAKKEGLPYLAIIDSWTVLNTKASMDNVEENIKNSEKNELSMWAGGQMMKARSGRHWLNLLMPMMYECPATILLINQASTTVSRFTTGIASGGGYGLKHDIQFSICFTKKDTLEEGDVKLGFVDTTISNSEVNIDKSKFIPAIQGIPITIDVAEGGKIISKKELVALAKAKGIIQQSGSWYTVEGLDKKFRWQDIENIEGIETVFKDRLTELYRKQYKLVDIYYQEKDKRLAKLVHKVPELLVLENEKDVIDVITN